MRYYPSIFLEALRKTMKPSLRIVRIVRIAEQLPNKGLEITFK
jgi:hypothetical protein